MFGAALFVAVLPGTAMLLLAVLPSAETEVYVAAFVFISVLLAQFFRCVVGMAGLLLASNTSWPRRVAAAGVFLFACLLALVKAPIVPDAMRPVTGLASESPSPMTAGVSGALVMFWALAYISWNLVRNRGWRAHIAAPLIAVGVCAAAQLTSWGLTDVGDRAVVVNLAVHLQSVGLIACGFWLFHRFAQSWRFPKPSNF